MYIKIINNEPKQYSLAQLRSDNPNTSFPKNISSEILASYNVYPVTRSSVPAYNKLTHLARSIDPVIVDGQWVQQWEVIELPLLQQIENLRAARAEAYNAEADPIFFRVQRGEADLADWEVAVQEIRNRFPYPEEES